MNHHARSLVRIVSITLTVLACGGVAPLNADAQTKSFQQAGPRGGTLSGGTSQKGNNISGTATATSANGKTATASGVATIKPGSVSAQGTAAGPNGGNASGTVTAANGTLNASGTATGKAGHTVGGSMTAAQGSATLTNTAGNSKTFSNTNRPPRR
jgi:hypothetical protein